MDVLDYMERESRATFAEAMRSYTETHERGYRLATVVLPAAGALAAYAAAEWSAGRLRVAVLAAALALCWFLVIGALLWFGMRAYQLSDGATPGSLMRAYEPMPGAWDEVCYPDASPRREGAYPGGPLVDLRRRELLTVDLRISAYQAAVTERAEWLHWAYRMLALSPLAPAAAALALALLGRW